ncbi:MAG: HEAT repeat domain-containing protein [Desulfamplus sp.]|nr:HEAT repeat domain-containing protein [Desulfamplus sp.]
MKGEGFYTAAYTIFIPFVIFYILNLLSANTICRLLNSTELKSNQKLSIAIMAISISIIAILYYFNCDKDFFLRVRDYLILSSKLGEVFNDFYYRYTLYAAEAVRPASYKLMRVLSLIGLTIILPTIVYLTFFFINLYSINLIIKKVKIYKNMATEAINISAIIAGVINIVIALFIFYRLYPTYTIPKHILTTKAMLYHQQDYRIRVEGLKKLCRSDVVYTKRRVNTNGDNIWNYPEFIATMIKQNDPTYKINGNIVEKYWLANAFGAAKKLDALPYLENLINDPSINVQCAAIEAMASIAVNNSNLDISHFFKDKIVNSNELYVQKRAHNALKRVRKL